ncbi:MAG TPA: NADPH-dependent oxidoreductase [Bacteroidetes bacterium]|nr:NADPH-dependent oxidoreductase [Bacteroidota bacterium]
MKHTILSGSSRKNSTSLLVSRALERVLAELGENEVEVVNFEDYDIPFFNGELDINALTPFQDRLISSMRNADAILFVTPEYNWFPSAEMVQLVHRLAETHFKDLWNHKVFSFVGVSSGRGGRMPAVQLSYVVAKIINVFNLDSLTNPKSFEVQFAGKVLDTAGNSLGSAEFDKGVSAFLDYHIRLTKRWLLGGEK